MVKINTAFATHISNIYCDEYFHSGGAGYPNYFDEKEILIKHGRYYGEVLSKYGLQTGKLLDIGAAAGFVLKGLTEKGWKGYGVEPNDHMAAYARNKLGLNVQTGTLEAFRMEERFDVICFIQVIAHFINPYTAMKVACKQLSSEGYILIETWNYKSLTARFFGKHWHEYSPPSVLQWFSPLSLNALVNQFEFELVATGRPPKKIIWKHARSLLQYKLMRVPFFSLIKRLLHIIPDHILLSYPAEDLFWSLYKRI